MNIDELKQLQNKWVAFSEDRKKIITKSKTLDGLLRKTNGRSDIIVSYIPPADMTISP